jgi:RNA polymerase sigma-70 factor (ECF subfamily)
LKQQLNIEKVVKGCQNGKAKYQKALYNHFASKMMGICVRYCRDIDLAKDAMQEGFVKVFKHIDGFKAESKIDTWMTRIMINTTLNHLKKNKRYEYIDDNAGMEHAVNNRHDVSADAVSAINHAELIAMLQELPDGYRMVFNLYAVEGYTHREIAEQLNISEGTSKSQLNRARKQLQSLVVSRMGYRNSV